MFTRDNILMYEKQISNQKRGIVLPIYQDNKYVWGDARYTCHECGARVICPGCEKITRIGELNICLN